MMCNPLLSLLLHLMCPVVGCCASDHAGVLHEYALRGASEAPPPTARGGGACHGTETPGPNPGSGQLQPQSPPIQAMLGPRGPGGPGLVGPVTARGRG